MGKSINEHRDDFKEKNKDRFISQKPTTIEYHVRLQKVFDMTVQGRSREYVVQFFAKKYGTSTRTVDNYLKEARKKIKKLNTKKGSRRILELAIAQMNDLYSKNYNRKDFRESRAVIESRAKLLGHYKRDNSQRDDNSKNVVIFKIPDNGRE